MGASYWTVLVFGAVIDPVEFVEVRKREEVRCAHPEADGPTVKFCPTCGTPKAQRVLSFEEEHPLPRYEGKAPFPDIYSDGRRVGTFAAWLRETARDYGESAFDGLDLHDLNSHEWNGKPVYLLGEVISEIRVDGHSERKVITPADLDAARERVLTKLAEWGIQGPPALYHALNCSA